MGFEAVQRRWKGHQGLPAIHDRDRTPGAMGHKPRGVPMGDLRADGAREGALGSIELGCFQEPLALGLQGLAQQRHPVQLWILGNQGLGHSARILQHLPVFTEGGEG